MKLMVIGGGGREHAIIKKLKENSEITEKNISGDVRIKLLAERILVKKPAFVFSINYFPYISAIKEIMESIGFMWEPTRDSGDLYEPDTQFFHKTICFSIERSYE